MEVSVFPEIKTNRLVLRQLAEGDIQPLFNLRSNDQVNAYINRNKPLHNSEIKAFISDRIQDFKDSKMIYWAICKNNNPTLIGTVCLWNFNHSQKSAEIGYELHPNFHGQGLMSEVLTATLNYGFKLIKLQTIEAFTHKYNTSSQKLLQRFGFVVNPDRFDLHNKDNLIFEKTHA